jgi:hypothetical protein
MKTNPLLTRLARLLFRDASRIRWVLDPAKRPEGSFLLIAGGRAIALTRKNQSFKS